jgi:hypothetical protein
MTRKLDCNENVQEEVYLLQLELLQLLHSTTTFPIIHQNRVTKEN